MTPYRGRGTRTQGVPCSHFQVEQRRGQVGKESRPVAVIVLLSLQVCCLEQPHSTQQYVQSVYKTHRARLSNTSGECAGVPDTGWNSEGRERRHKARWPLGQFINTG